MSQISIKFHIKNDDYFGTLAAILNLIEQTEKNKKLNLKIFNNIIKDLIFLQKEYKIVKKRKSY